MNKRRILEVADAIETPEIPGFHFRMNTFREPALVVVDTPENKPVWKQCGYAGCIAGTTVALYDGLEDYAKLENIYERAIELLDLGPDDGESTDTIGHRLFIPMVPGGMAMVTPEKAAAVLRHLANTGEVDWEVEPEREKEVIDAMLNW